MPGAVTILDNILVNKLCRLGRDECIQRFQDLRDDNVIPTNLRNAVRNLETDPYSVEYRVAAVCLALVELWPLGSNWWRKEREFSLVGPNFDTDKDARRALIIVKQANKDTGPISTVTLHGQQGRLDFDLQQSSGLYRLCEAVLDSELTFQENFPVLPAALPTMEMIHAQTEARRQLQEKNELHFAHLNGVEKAWLEKRHYSTRTHRRARSRPRSKRIPKTERTPQKPLGTSGLQYGLLSVSPVPFHFHTKRIDGFPGIPSDPCEPRSHTTVIVDGLPRCDIDRKALRQMMTQASIFLERKNDLLSNELCDLRPKICDFSTPMEERILGIVTCAVISKAPEEWGPNVNDEIHITCQEGVTDSIVIWVLDVGHGRKKWVVKIQRKRLDHLLAMFTTRVAVKRKFRVMWRLE